MSAAEVAGAVEGPVEKLTTFFSTRLLLRRYRPSNRGEAVVPEAVGQCERAFRALAERAVADVNAGKVLDAMEWMETCTEFSEEWIDFCHWISPKKLREHLTEIVGAQWCREEEIPAERELPPWDLKLYKADMSLVQQYACPCCEVECNSLAQYKGHAAGHRHKTNAEAWALNNGGKMPEPVMVRVKLESARMALEQRKEKQRREREARVVAPPTLQDMPPLETDAQPVSSVSSYVENSEPADGCDSPACSSVVEEATSGLLTVERLMQLKWNEVTKLAQANGTPMPDEYRDLDFHFDFDDEEEEALAAFENPYALKAC
eukprot:TRINITY_DN4862_c0_g2_i1.p1 TRINITY_DN4862_c0_g2~~TRINITY_DN4862_c0_g2_i1.p1  ORF type:complete len:319 (+),score=92.61 TRINITY_DN4862_c0_g2_i1:54-1010(+)